MGNQWSEQQQRLLRALSNIGGAGRAEGEPADKVPLGFYPVSEHLRLLDPEVVLVVGPRGSGKTEIARVLNEAELFAAISRFAPAVRLPSGSSEWKEAYPANRQGFDAVGLRDFIGRHQDDIEPLRELWFAYLVRTLAGSISPESRAGIDALLTPPGADLEAIFSAFRGLGTTPVVVLDQLDEKLEKEDRYIFLTYDELDTLGGGEWRLVEAGVRGLVAFWAAYARRWKRIRAKLFLRTDLYERHAKAGGADLSKLAAGRVDLIWSDRDLYGLLLKRLANIDADLAEYVKRGKGITWTEDNALGAIPQLRTWQDARPVVERMVGAHMGANQKKGLAYRWLLDHVRDGRGRAFPRPFVRLIEEAARLELQSPNLLREPRLIDPASLRRALDHVSRDHVADTREELPWLDKVKERLAVNALVPWERERDAIALFEELTTGTQREMLPFKGRELFEYLIELGILRRRPDGRVDAPDLFLSGLGLRRKGGVKKRR